MNSYSRGIVRSNRPGAHAALVCVFALMAGRDAMADTTPSSPSAAATARVTLAAPAPAVPPAPPPPAAPATVGAVPPAPPPPPAPAATGAAVPAAPVPANPQAENLKEAETRFERGLALYDDGDLDAALVEFNRAYALAPTYKILYNIAKIERAKNDYSSALRHFRRYLSEGGAGVPADRQAEVSKEIGVLESRVAEVTIVANVAAADVYVDDIPVCGARIPDPECVGSTPMSKPVLVNPGTRTVTAQKRGFQSGYAQVTVAGGDHANVKLDLLDLRPRSEDAGPRNRAVASWVVTGALAVGAGVMGGVTLAEKNTYNQDAGKLPCSVVVSGSNCNQNTASTLSSDKNNVRTFAVVTDVLTGAAVVAAGISIYFTVKASGKSSEASDHALLHDLHLTAGPGTAAFAGTF